MGKIDSPIKKFKVMFMVAHSYHGAYLIPMEGGLTTPMWQDITDDILIPLAAKWFGTGQPWNLYADGQRCG